MKRTPPSPIEPRHNLLHVGRRAMACEFEVCLPARQYADCLETVLQSLDLVEQLERQMTAFGESSEIARINQTAADRPVAVEPRLFELLQLAARLWQESQGAYDITAGPLWEAWGFARRAGAVPAPPQLAEARSRVGGHLIQLDSGRQTIRFLRPGVQLNLGSIGKGYAVDRCAEYLLAAGISDFLVHGGQSSVLAHGSPEGSGVRDETERGQSHFRRTKTGTVPDAREGWTVGIRHPLESDRRLAEVRLCNRALGTSGTQFQAFRHRGHRYGHILDPRSGEPAEGVASVTVLAPTAALADALSTAFFVMGPAAAADYCRQRPEIAAVLVSSPAGGGNARVHSFGLEERLE